MGATPPPFTENFAKTINFFYPFPYTTWMGDRLTLLAAYLTPRNSSPWHNLYDCVVQILYRLMDPSFSQKILVNKATR